MQMDRARFRLSTPPDPRAAEELGHCLRNYSTINKGASVTVLNRFCTGASVTALNRFCTGASATALNRSP